MIKNGVYGGGITTSLGIQAGWVIKDNPYINNSCWYMSVLLLCYVVLYIEVWVSEKLKVKHTNLLLFMVFLGVGGLTYEVNMPFFNFYSCRGYMAFFGGVFLAESKKKWFNAKNKVLIGGMICLSVILVMLVFCGFSSQNQFEVTFLLWPTIILVLDSDFFVWIKKIRILQTIAAISFEVYLWSTPWLYAITFMHPDFMSEYIPTRVGMVTTLAVLYVIALLLWKYVERPLGRKVLLKLKKNNKK